MTFQTVANFDRIGEENAFAVLARATALAQAGRDVINLGIGQPDFSPPRHILEAAEKAVRDGPHGYTTPIGILPLREAVAAEWTRAYGGTVPPENVAITQGCNQAFCAAIAASKPATSTERPCSRSASCVRSSGKP